MAAARSDPGTPDRHGLADGVRRHGFRKWYERELLAGHAHMVLAVLASVGLVGLMEGFAEASRADKLLTALLFIACAAIGLWALRRYLYLLNHAEAVANQAICSGCDAYGRFDVEHEDRRAAQLLVRCRRCGHRWSICE